MNTRAIEVRCTRQVSIQLHVDKHDFWSSLLGRWQGQPRADCYSFLLMIVCGRDPVSFPALSFILISQLSGLERLNQYWVAAFDALSCTGWIGLSSVCLIISGSLIRAQFLYNKDVVIIDVIACCFIVWFTYAIGDHAVFGVIYGYLGLICFMSALPLVFKGMRNSTALLSYRLALSTILAMGLLVGVIAAISEGLARV